MRAEINAKAMKAKAMMYKRPAMASIGYDAMISGLYEIQEALMTALKARIEKARSIKRG